MLEFYGRIPAVLDFRKEVNHHLTVDFCRKMLQCLVFFGLRVKVGSCNTLVFFVEGPSMWTRFFSTATDALLWKKSLGMS